MDVSPIPIDCDFPGGNVIDDGHDGDIVHIRPDLRDTDRHCFHWHFRVRGGAGRRLRFQFTVPRRCVTAAGPCVSVDGGETWQWLGEVERDAEGHEHFEYAFAEDAGRRAGPRTGLWASPPAASARRARAARTRGL